MQIQTETPLEMKKMKNNVDGMIGKMKMKKDPAIASENDLILIY